jgi:hypothetical protein
MANSNLDSSLSQLRRQLLSAAPELADSANSDTVDFDNVSEAGGLGNELQSLLRPKAATASSQDDIESLLQQYQAEKTIPDSPAPRWAKREPTVASGNRTLPGSRLGGRPTPPRGLPPLTTATQAELERLRQENTELKQLLEEYRELLEANDPAVWEQRLQEAQQTLAEKDEQLKSLRTQVEEWEERFKTHRFVPHDDELAKEADELDKERVRLAQERKALETERQQLKEDEEAMMAQMREMEIGMAKDRAELARQRTELQRLQAEIQHELDLLQRGDASLKERLAQFQRRCHDATGRPSPGGTGIFTAAVPPAASSASTQTAGPKETAVFKKLFGQSR